jgi:hypothetical protein
MNKLLRKRTSSLTGKIDEVVPPPRERTNLIRAIYIEAGHFGVHKTPKSFLVGADLLLDRNICAGPQGSFFLHGL